MWRSWISVRYTAAPLCARTKTALRLDAQRVQGQTDLQQVYCTGRRLLAFWISWISSSHDAVAGESGVLVSCIWPLTLQHLNWSAPVWRIEKVIRHSKERAYRSVCVSVSGRCGGSGEVKRVHFSGRRLGCWDNREMTHTWRATFRKSGHTVSPVDSLTKTITATHTHLTAACVEMINPCPL